MVFRGIGREVSSPFFPLTNHHPLSYTITCQPSPLTLTLTTPHTYPHPQNADKQGLQRVSVRV